MRRGVPPSLSYCSLGPGSRKRGKRLSVCQSRSLFGFISIFSELGARRGIKMFPYGKSTAVLHTLCHPTHRAGVAGHVGQLQLLQLENGEPVNGVALIDRGVGVVLERNFLTQHDEDAREEQGQEYLHQSHQDLTFLESKNRSKAWLRGFFLRRRRRGFARNCEAKDVRRPVPRGLCMGTKRRKPGWALAEAVPRELLTVLKVQGIKVEEELVDEGLTLCTEEYPEL
ncbi:hypothetical protein EYF80_020879 [Liparis tanakae]|uniref:Uncharacterized protein n=1 Tax=Liparis tanakae TaxID=230148 RepID=A0A4Z2HV00_9TELE|nr:hypothetical protein EYF80_020879 [Liparis tanakae]